MNERELKTRFRAAADQRIADQKLNKAKFANQERAVAAALAAADRATTKSEMAMEKRFDNTNEWRATVEGLQRTYLPRQEFDAVKLAYDERISALKEQVAINSGKGKGMGEMLATILSVIAVLTAIAAIVFPWRHT
jgi:gamma-glutamyl:cysteine ligase YbdK (ATP-grasp superfamily)